MTDIREHIETLEANGQLDSADIMESLEAKRQALWYALVAAHQSNGLRLGEAQIESDLVMDMAVKALEKKGRSD